MQIPKVDDRMTVSPSQMRTYGAGGFMLDEQETTRGCPRRYKAKYVDKIVEDDEEESYPLKYGTFFHSVMERLHEGDTPEEALVNAFPADGTPEMMQEARDDLARYLERAANPLDLYAPLHTEQMLSALLYDDEDYGPVWIRGMIDLIAVDHETPGVVHVIDYKTNRFPPSIEAVRGDVQLKTYDYLVRQNAERLGLPKNVRVRVHLDAIKFREVEVGFTDDDIENWRMWAEAVCRTILRDEKAEPVINPGCDWCPVQNTCPAFQALPEVAEELVEAEDGITNPEVRLRWRNRANEIRLLLEKKVKRIDASFQREAEAKNGLVVGDTQWTVVPKYTVEVDKRALHRALGNQFYEVVNVVKGRVEAATRDFDSHELKQVNDAFRSVPNGMEVKKRKVE